MPVAIVTGAGRGIGAAISARLAADGYDVVRLDLDPDVDVPETDVDGLRADDDGGGRVDGVRKGRADDGDSDGAGDGVGVGVGVGDGDGRVDGVREGRADDDGDSDGAGDGAGDGVGVGDGDGRVDGVGEGHGDGRTDRVGNRDRVAVVDRDSEVIGCDVADPDAVRRISAEIGPVDVLVNNAGAWAFGPLEAVDPSEFRRVLAVNLGGTFNCTQAFGRTMLDRGGSIVNIVSIAAHSPNPSVGSYSASKAAVLALTRQTAIEWGPRGVRANAVGPGFVPTPGTGDVYRDASVRAVRAAAVPLRRLGTPDDVANVVAFLAGPESAYVTGQVIYVDGGVTESLMTLIPRPEVVPGPHP